jgi:hypothetical protein
MKYATIILLFVSTSVMAQDMAPREQAANMLLNQSLAREKELAAAAFGLQRQVQDLTKERDELKAKSAPPADAK